MRRLADTDLPAHVMQRWDNNPEFSFVMKYKLIFKEDPIPKEPFAVHMLFIQVRGWRMRRTEGNGGRRALMAVRVMRIVLVMVQCTQCGGSNPSSGRCL